MAQKIGRAIMNKCLKEIYIKIKITNRAKDKRVNRIHKSKDGTMI